MGIIKELVEIGPNEVCDTVAMDTYIRTIITTLPDIAM